MLNQKQIKRISDIGSILLYVLPAAYLFLSATLFQFSILTDLTKALQKQIPNPAYQNEQPVLIANAPIDLLATDETSPLIPASKSIYLYFLVMTALILTVVILSIFGQNLHYFLVPFYQFFFPPTARIFTPHLRAPPIH